MVCYCPLRWEENRRKFSHYSPSQECPEQSPARQFLVKTDRSLSALLSSDLQKLYLEPVASLLRGRACEALTSPLLVRRRELGRRAKRASNLAAVVAENMDNFPCLGFTSDRPTVKNCQVASTAVKGKLVTVPRIAFERFDFFSHNSITLPRFESFSAMTFADP